MGKNNNFVKEITPMEENFAQWYTDVIRSCMGNNGWTKRTT